MINKSLAASFFNTTRQIAAKIIARGGEAGEADGMMIDLPSGPLFPAFYAVGQIEFLLFFRSI